MKLARKVITFLFIASTALLQVACHASDDAVSSANAPLIASASTSITPDNTPVECAGESLMVQNISPYRDGNNHWWLIGQVQNFMTEDVPFATLCIQMEEPGQSSTEPWLLDTTLRAGETAPFRALINSRHVSNKTRFKVTAHAADPGMTLNINSDLLSYREIRHSDIQVRPAQEGLQFTGQLTNVGKVSANNIRVIIAIFDKSNRLIGVADGNAPTLSDVDPLKPGAAVEFTASTSHINGQMERYEIAIIEGRSIEAVRGFQN